MSSGDDRVEDVRINHSARIRNLESFNELDPTSEHQKLAWSCRSCGWLEVSDSREHHTMDWCACGDSGCDLETYHVRWSGQAVPVAKQQAGSTEWTPITKETTDQPDEEADE